MLDDQVDVAIVRPPFRHDATLRMVELDREPLLLVVREGHPLARRSMVGLADVVAQPFLESPRVRDQQFAAFWYLRDIRTTEAVPSRATTVEEWLAEIVLGRGVNLIPAGFAADYQRPGWRSFPSTGFHQRALCWPGDRRPLMAAPTGSSSSPPASPGGGCDQRARACRTFMIAETGAFRVLAHGNRTIRRSTSGWCAAMVA